MTAIRAVLDTNVLVSGLVAEHGAPRQLLDAWLDGRYTLVSSVYLIEEFAYVLTYPRIAERLQLDQHQLKTLLAALLSKAEITPGRDLAPGATRDPKDDAILGCAREGQADYIVSGDQDLLVLGEYEGIQIVSPQQFIRILASATS